MASEVNWTVQSLLEHAEWIRKLAHVLVRDPALADDLAQDTWVAALRSPPKQQGPLKPWLATILRNLVRERARGNERRARREQASPPPAAAEPVEDLAQRAEAQRLLVEFVLELPQHYRDVVLLSYFEGLSGPEIADRLGAPEVTVRSRLKRGLDQLRERFDRKYGERKAWIVMLLPLAKRPGDGVGVGVWAKAAGVEGAAHEDAGPVRSPSGVLRGIAFIAVVGFLAWLLFGPADREPDRSLATLGGARDVPSVESAASAPSAPMGLDSGVRSSGAVESDVGPPPGTPLAAYEVVVRDDAGRAVEGATVRAEWHVVRPDILALVQNSSPIARRLGETTTDASGFASIECPRGLMFDVSIEAPNYPTERLRQRLSGDRDRITLQPPASLVGTVKSVATGEPVEGAWIELMRSSVSDVRRLASTRSDAAGAFRVDGLPNARLLAIVVAEGFELNAVGITPLPGRANVLDVTLGNAVKLHGRVVDAHTRDPIAGAELGMLNGTIALRTDEEGRFRTTYFAAEKLEFGYLWLEAPGYGYRTLFPTLSPGEARDVELLVELEPARVVRGQAVDERGEPIVGLRILARSEQPDAEHPTQQYPDGFPKADLRIAVTDDRGRFEFGNLRPDTRHFLLPDDARYALQSTLVPARRADLADEDVGTVVFADARTIYGRVLDAADRPLPGIDVFAIPHPPLLRQIAPNESLDGLFAVDVQTTRTDSDGWFCFRTLGYGDVLLRLFDPAYGLLEQVIVGAEASQRSAMFEPHIDVRPDISGWVRDAAGAPVDIAAVTAHRPGTPAAKDVEVFTRSDGSFCLYRLKAGTYELSAQVRSPYVDSRPMTAATASVEHGMHGVTLVMHPAQLVELSVMNRDGLPIVGARCRFVDPTDPRTEYERSVLTVAGCTIALPEHRDFEVQIDLLEDASGAGVRTHQAHFRTTSRSERGRFVFQVAD